MEIETTVAPSEDLVAERGEIEARLVQAYAGEADSLLEEVEELIDKQSWSNGWTRPDQRAGGKNRI